MKKFGLIIFGLGLLFYTACKKDIIQETAPDSPTTMETLKVDTDFNWKTTKDYTIGFKSAKDGLVNVMSSKGLSYQKAFLKANDVYDMKLSIPAYEKSVKLDFLGQETVLELNSTNLNHTF